MSKGLEHDRQVKSPTLVAFWYGPFVPGQLVILGD
jgi:hypothetical protein